MFLKFNYYILLCKNILKSFYKFCITDLGLPVTSLADWSFTSRGWFPLKFKICKRLFKFAGWIPTYAHPYFKLIIDPKACSFKGLEEIQKIWKKVSQKILTTLLKTNGIYYYIKIIVSIYNDKCYCFINNILTVAR